MASTFSPLQKLFNKLSSTKKRAAQLFIPKVKLDSSNFHFIKTKMVSIFVVLLIIQQQQNKSLVPDEIFSLFSTLYQTNEWKAKGNFKTNRKMEGGKEWHIHNLRKKHHHNHYYHCSRASSMFLKVSKRSKEWKD